LKLTLFERSRRGAKLTPVGAAILPAVRKFAQQVERLELAVREAAAGQTGVLTIGAISSAMLDVLPPLLATLRQRHPELTVSVREIDSAEAIPSLESGDIDLAFARLEGDMGESIGSMPLKQDKLAVALPKGHRFAEMAHIRLASLVDEDFVMFARQVSPVYFDGLTAACLAHGFSPRVIHETRSVASQVAFVGCGQGIALVPASMKKLAPENVVLRPLKENLRVVTTAVAWSKKRNVPLVEEITALLGGGTPKAQSRKAAP